MLYPIEKHESETRSTSLIDTICIFVSREQVSSNQTDDADEGEGAENE